MLRVKTTSAIHIFKEIKSDLWNCTNIVTVSARTYQTINLKNGTLYAATWSGKLKNV